MVQALRGVADPLRTIAIVGNGPITAYQRQQIEAADAIIRFNKLDNWCVTDSLSRRSIGGFTSRTELLHY